MIRIVFWSFPTKAAFLLYWVEAVVPEPWANRICRYSEQREMCLVPQLLLQVLFRSEWSEYNDLKSILGPITKKTTTKLEICITKGIPTWLFTASTVACCSWALLTSCCCSCWMWLVSCFFCSCWANKACAFKARREYKQAMVNISLSKILVAGPRRLKKWWFGSRSQGVRKRRSRFYIQILLTKKEFKMLLFCLYLAIPD